MLAKVNLHGFCQTLCTRHTYSAEQTKEVIFKKGLVRGLFLLFLLPSICFSTSDSGMYVFSRLWPIFFSHSCTTSFMLLMLGSGRISSCLLRVRGSSTALIVNVPMSSSQLYTPVHWTSFGESQLNPKGKKMIYTRSSGWFCTYLQNVPTHFPNVTASSSTIYEARSGITKFLRWRTLMQELQALADKRLSRWQTFSIAITQNGNFIPGEFQLLLLRRMRKAEGPRAWEKAFKAEDPRA